MYLVINEDNGAMHAIVELLDDVDYFIEQYCESNGINEGHFFVQGFSKQSKEIGWYIEDFSSSFLVWYVDGRIYCEDDVLPDGRIVRVDY